MIFGIAGAKNGQTQGRLGNKSAGPRYPRPMMIRTRTTPRDQLPTLGSVAIARPGLSQSDRRRVEGRKDREYYGTRCGFATY